MISLTIRELREVWVTTLFVGFGFSGMVQALVDLEWARAVLLLVVSAALALYTLQLSGLYDWQRRFRS